MARMASCVVLNPIVQEWKDVYCTIEEILEGRNNEKVRSCLKSVDRKMKEKRKERKDGGWVRGESERLS